jgi:hypothetical protein
MLGFGEELDLPSAEGLTVNATGEEVRGALDDLLGLGCFDIEQYGGGRERVRASVSHAIQFCLHAQTELMSPTHLFHRGGEAEVATDFAELFPYLLAGALEPGVSPLLPAVGALGGIARGDLSGTVQHLHARASGLQLTPTCTAPRALRST